MEFLEYFFDAPYTGSKKTPLLLLFTSRPVDDVNLIDACEIEGAVLLHEYQMMGQGLQIFVSEDLGGERNVIAPLSSRSLVAARACRFLLDRGAHLVLLSVKDGTFNQELFTQVADLRRSRNYQWSAGLRELTRYMPLWESYDATLATMGSHTRRNLRYYRKRMESDFGCTFLSSAEMTEAEFVAMNRICAYPVPDEVASWRYNSARSVVGGLFAGLRAANGDWLSILGCRHFHPTTAIDWQMNRNDLSAYSLSTVMRSYLLEYEVTRGTTSLLFEGGTPHSMRSSFLTDRVIDLTVMRSSVPALLLRRYVRSILPEKNSLVEAITSPGLEWHGW